MVADQHGASAAYTDRAGREQVRAAFTQEQKWLDSVTRVLGALAQAKQAAHAQKTGADEVIDIVADAVDRGVVFVVLRHPEWGPLNEVHAEIIDTVRASMRAWTRNRPDPGHPSAA